MDPYAKALTKTLKPLVGDAAGLMILRELDDLGYGHQIRFLTFRQRELLANCIADHIGSHIYSPHRLAMFRSKLLGILGASVRVLNMHEADSIKWG